MAPEISELVGYASTAAYAAVTGGFLAYVLYGVPEDLRYVRQLRTDARSIVENAGKQDISSLTTDQVLGMYQTLNRLLERPIIGGRRLRREARGVYDSLRRRLRQQVVGEIVLQMGFVPNDLNQHLAFSPTFEGVRRIRGF